MSVLSPSAGVVSRIKPDDIRALKAEFPTAFAGRSRARRNRRIGLAAVFGYVVFCLIYFEITPQRLFGGLSNSWNLLKRMVYWEDVASWQYASIFWSLAETLAMAFAGTLLASCCALFIGFFAAKNVIRQPILRHAVRRVLDVLRGVDQLIWALVFVRAVGLGPLAGVLAIFVSDTGTLSKLYSEAIENLDDKPVEGVRATGASNIALWRFGALPQVLPVFLSQSLYFFESNTRSATILGIVGAGGIGLQLSERIRTNHWDQAAFIIVLIFITVALIDALSATIRRRFIGERV